MATLHMCTVSLILIILIVQASAQPQAGNEADFEDWLTWEPSEEIRQLYPMTRVGYDKNGSAVYVKEMGKWNARALGAQPKEKQDEFWKYFEKLVRLQEKDAKIPPGGAGCRTEPAEGIVVIYDFDGFRFNHNVTVEGNQDQALLFKQLTYLARETAATKTGFMINMGAEVNLFAKLTGAAPFLGHYVKKLEKFDDSEAQAWKQRLLEIIPVDQLPAKYGGSKGVKSSGSCIWCKRTDDLLNQLTGLRRFF